MQVGPNHLVRLGFFVLTLNPSCCKLSDRLLLLFTPAQFGEVSRGRYRPLGRREVLVAVKTLRWGASDREKGMFLSEAGVLGQFDHPNVLKLEGVITRSPPERIITEFMENGPLDSFLRVRQHPVRLHHNPNPPNPITLCTLNSFRRTRASSVSCSSSGCSEALVQGCDTSLRGTLSTETWQPGTCWSTPTWSAKCLTLACPDS